MNSLAPSSKTTRKRASLLTCNTLLESFRSNVTPSLNGPNLPRGRASPLGRTVAQPNEICLQFFQFPRLKPLHLVLDGEQRHSGKDAREDSVVKMARAERAISCAASGPGNIPSTVPPAALPGLEARAGGYAGKCRLSFARTKRALSAKPAPRSSAKMAS